MDGRAAFRMSVCLLIASAGCQHQVMNLPNPTSGSSPAVSPGSFQAKKTPAKSKELPPAVLVSYASFQASEAFAAATEPDRRQTLCDAARTTYEKALSIDPKCVPAYQGLARLYTNSNELPLAVEAYQKALKIAPNNAAVWFEMGLCRNYQKDFSTALECLDKAARIDPGNRSYSDALGVILAEAGRYNDSLKCFSRSCGEAMGCYRLAQTLDHLNKPELSRHFMEVAVQKDPSLAPPIQQASYEQVGDPVPSAPPAQTASPAPSAPPAPSQILVPPVPPLHDDDEQAKP